MTATSPAFGVYTEDKGQRGTRQGACPRTPSPGSLQLSGSLGLEGPPLPHSPSSRSRSFPAGPADIHPRERERRPGSEAQKVSRPSHRQPGLRVRFLSPGLPGDTGQWLPVLAPESSTPELCGVQCVTLEEKMGAQAAMRLPTSAGAPCQLRPPEVSPYDISSPRSPFLEVPSRELPSGAG